MKRLVILGGGESGAGAAKLGKKLGYEVFLSDKGKLADKYKRMLEELGVEYEEGQLGRTYFHRGFGGEKSGYPG